MSLPVEGVGVRVGALEVVWAAGCILTSWPLWGLTVPSNDDLFVVKDLKYAYLGRFPALDGLVFPDSGRYVAFGEELTEDRCRWGARRSRPGWPTLSASICGLSPT
jgi:hypothetical protein